MEEKEDQYAAIILGKLRELFDNDCESDYKIDIEELNKDNNLTHFIHALANMAPCIVYHQLTGDNVNNLRFNHIANQLCFQYSIIVKD